MGAKSLVKIIWEREYSYDLKPHPKKQNGCLGRPYK